MDGRIRTGDMGTRMQSDTPAAGKEPGFPPLVSVIIPTHNRAWTLEKAVRSVFADSHRPIECIVVDDGSTDDTAAVLAHLQKECPDGIDLRYIRQENGGANSARNRGLAACTGNFICFLDSDDYFINDSIRARAGALLENQDADLCYGISSIRNEEGKMIGTMNSPWPGEQETRITKYFFDTNSPMMRRSLCAKAGSWREDDLHGQEQEYFARLRFFSKEVLFVDKELSVYVKHEKGHILNASVEFSLALFRVLLCIKALVLYSEYDKKCERQQLAMEFRHVAKRLYRAKDYRNACKALEESLLLNTSVKVIAQWFAVKCIGAAGRLTNDSNERRIDR